MIQKVSILFIFLFWLVFQQDSYSQQSKKSISKTDTQTRAQAATQKLYYQQNIRKTHRNRLLTLRKSHDLRMEMLRKKIRHGLQTRGGNHWKKALQEYRQQCLREWETRYKR